MKVAVVGATGLIGRRVIRALADRGDEVVAVSRSGAEVSGGRPVAWDAAEPLPAAAREGVDAVVNLAGEPLLGRWTEAKKRAIRGEPHRDHAAHRRGGRRGRSGDAGERKRGGLLR